MGTCRRHSRHFSAENACSNLRRHGERLFGGTQKADGQSIVQKHVDSSLSDSIAVCRACLLHCRRRKCNCADDRQLCTYCKVCVSDGLAGVSYSVVGVHLLVGQSVAKGPCRFCTNVVAVSFRRRVDRGGKFVAGVRCRRVLSSDDCFVVHVEQHSPKGTSLAPRKPNAQPVGREVARHRVDVINKESIQKGLMQVVVKPFLIGKFCCEDNARFLKKGSKRDVTAKGLRVRHVCKMAVRIRFVENFIQLFENSKNVEAKNETYNEACIGTF